MKRQQNNQFDNLIARRVHSGMMRRVVALMSAFVLLMTMNTLKLEADAMERIATCGYPDHEHQAECYDDAGELICERHVHTDACFQERPVSDIASTRLDDYIPLNATVDLYGTAAQDGDDALDAVTAEPVEDAVDETVVNLVEGGAQPTDAADEDNGLSIDGEETLPEGTVIEAQETPAVEEAPEAITEAEEETSYTYEIGEAAQVALADILSANGLEPGDIIEAGPATRDGALVAVTPDEDGAYTVESLASYDKAEIVVIAANGEFVIELTDARIEADTEEETETEDEIKDETEEDTEEETEDETEEEIEEEAEGEDAVADEAPVEDAKVAEDDNIIVETDDAETTEETAEGEAEPEEVPFVAIEDFAVPQLTVNVDFAAIARTGIDFEQDAVVSALNEGVELDVNELLATSDSDTGLDVVVESESAAPEAVQESVAADALQVVETTGGVEYADGAISVTGDGTVALTDGENNVVVNVSNYAELVPEVTDAEATIKVTPVSDTAVLPDGEAVFEEKSDADIEALFVDLKGEPSETVVDENGNTGVRTMHVQVFDIGLSNNNEIVEPGFEVKVEAAFKAPIEGEDFELYHIVDGVPMQVESAEFTADESAATGMEFVTDSFSPYAVVWYTVDFEYTDENGEKITWKWPGEDSYKISDIMAEIGVTGEIGDVSLVRTVDEGGAENVLYLSKDKTELISDAAFDDTFELIVVVDGKTYVFVITDLAGGNTVSGRMMISSSNATGYSASLESDVTYNENEEKFSAKFKVNFTIQPSDIKNAGYNYYIPLSSDVEIPSSLLNQDFSAYDSTQKMESFKYRYVKNDDGSYAILINYDQDYIAYMIEKNLPITENFVKFESLITRIKTSDETSQTVAVTKDLDVTIPDSRFVYPDNVDKNHDIYTDKAYSHFYVDDNNLIHVVYTARISSKKGTGGNITVNDVLTFGQFSGHGYENDAQPKVNGVTIKSITKKDGTSVTIPSYTGTPGENSLTLNYSLDALGANEYYDVTYEYVYDKAYAVDVNIQDLRIEARGSNNMSVSTGSKPLIDTSSSDYTVIKTNSPVDVAKSPEYKSADNQIAWTITAAFKSEGSNKGPYKVVDAAFTDNSFVSGSLVVEDENGIAMDSGYTLTDDTITFNNPGTYYIRYRTNAQQLEYTRNRIQNTATGYNGSTTKDVTTYGEVPPSGKIEKSLKSTASATGTDENGSYTQYTLTWHIRIPVPADGFEAGTIITETMRASLNNGGAVYRHAFTEAQAAAFKAEFERYFGADSFEVLRAGKGEYSNDYEYKIELKNSWANPSNIDAIEFDYSTTGKIYDNEASVKTSSSNSGDKLYNKLSINDVTSNEAEWENTKFVSKKARSASINGAMSQDAVYSKGDITFNGSREVVWDIVLMLDQNYNDINVVDTLPDGLTLVNVAVGSEYNSLYLNKATPEATVFGLYSRDQYYTQYDGLGNEATYYSYGNVSDDRIQPVVPTATVSGQIVTVNLHLDPSDEDNRPPLFRKGSSLVVRIIAQVNDDQFNDFVDQAKSYTNRVSVTADENPKGEDQQTQTTTLKSGALSKSAQKNAFYTQNHQVDYTVEINKDEKHLLAPAQTTLELDDILTFSKAGVNFDFSVMLVPGSVKLYEVVNGVEVEYYDPAEPWTYTFEETTNGNDRTKTMHLKGIPDQKHLILRYSYQIDVADAQEGVTYNIPNIHNSATLHGDQTISSGKDVDETWEEASTQAGTKSASSLTIMKVDQENNYVTLANALFALEKYTSSGWVRIDAIENADNAAFMLTTTKDGKKVYKTNEDGLIRLSQPTSNGFEKDVAYKLVEVEPPEGYVLSNPAPEVYFYFSDTVGGSSSMLKPNDSVYAAKADNLLKGSDSLMLKNTKKPELIIVKTIKGEVDETQKQTLLNNITYDVEGVQTGIKLSAFTFDSATQTYTYRIDTGITNNRTYTVTENNANLDGVVRQTTYSVNSRPKQSGDSAAVLVRLGTGKVEYTNTYGEKEITAYKVWKDGNNASGIRPASITLNLLQNDVVYKTATVTENSMVDDKAWAVKWEHLPAGYTYTVEEPAVSGYNVAVEYSGGGTSLTSDGTVTITNTLTGLTVRKIWVDENNNTITDEAVLAMLPPVDIYLSADNAEVAGTRVTLTATDGYAYTWGNLDSSLYYTVCEDSSKLIPYGVTTDNNAAYVGLVPANESKNAEITNKVSPVIVKKVWKDKNGNDVSSEGKPAVTVKLMKDGVEVDRQVLNAANSWQYKWYGLNTTNNTYTVQEIESSDYTLVSVVYKDAWNNVSDKLTASGTATITNKEFEPDNTKTQIEVHKVWYEGNSNVTSSATETATVNLVRYKTEVQGTTIHILEAQYLTDHAQVMAARNTDITVVIPFTGDVSNGGQNLPKVVSEKPTVNYDGITAVISSTASGNNYETVTFNTGNNSDVYIVTNDWKDYSSNHLDCEKSMVTVTPAYVSTAQPEVDTSFEEMELSLTPSNNFTGNYYNLDVSGTEGDTNYTYSYAVVETVPTAEHYTIEYSKDGTTWTDTCESVSGAGKKTLYVKNTKTEPQTGSLEFTKYIDGIAVGNADSITFTITGPVGYEKTFTWADLNGTSTFETTASGEEGTKYFRKGTLTGLKPGTYTVTETNSSATSGYYKVVTTYSVVGGATNQTGTVTDVTVSAGGTAQVAFTNTYSELTDFAVQKRWIKDAVTANPDFTYTGVSTIWFNLYRKAGENGAVEYVNTYSITSAKQTISANATGDTVTGTPKAYDSETNGIPQNWLTVIKDLPLKDASGTTYEYYALECVDASGKIKKAGGTEIAKNYANIKLGASEGDARWDKASWSDILYYKEAYCQENYTEANVQAIKNMLVHVKVTKTWEDSGVTTLTHPAVTLRLNKQLDGDETATSMGDDYVFNIAEDSDDLTHDWGYLPAYDYATGKKITYSVTEDTVTGFKTEITCATETDAGCDYEYAFTVKNTWETTDISVEKKWLNLAGADITSEKGEVSFTLYQVGAETATIGTYTTANHTWSSTSVSLLTLPKYYQDANGEPQLYQYYVVESDLGIGFSLVSYVATPVEGAPITRTAPGISPSTAGINGGTITLTNQEYSTYELPSTGGPGTAIFYGAGASLMLFAFLGFVLNARKRSRGEGI